MMSIRLNGQEKTFDGDPENAPALFAGRPPAYERGRSSVAAWLLCAHARSIRNGWRSALPELP